MSYFVTVHDVNNCETYPLNIYFESEEDVHRYLSSTYKGFDPKNYKHISYNQENTQVEYKVYHIYFESEELEITVADSHPIHYISYHYIVKCRVVHEDVEFVFPEIYTSLEKVRKAIVKYFHTIKEPFLEKSLPEKQGDYMVIKEKKVWFFTIRKLPVI